MLKKAQKIIVTLAVILFTALTIYNTQRLVPVDNESYQAYCYSYFSINFFCFLLLIISCVIGYKNRIIKTGYLISFGTYMSMFWKSINHTVQSHNYYDFTLIGLVILVALIYLFQPYFKIAVSLFKHITNQIYAVCQRSRKRKT